MKIERLVISLKFAQKLKEDEFSDSALVWVKTGADDWKIEFREKMASCVECYPAPTTQEINEATRRACDEAYKKSPEWGDYFDDQPFFNFPNDAFAQWSEDITDIKEGSLNDQD